MGGETTRVENRGETTRGETTREETSWGRNVLLPPLAPGIPYLYRESLVAPKSTLFIKTNVRIFLMNSYATLNIGG